MEYTEEQTAVYKYLLSQYMDEYKARFIIDNQYYDLFYTFEYILDDFLVATGERLPEWIGIDYIDTWYNILSDYYMMIDAGSLVWQIENSRFIKFTIDLGAISWGLEC